MKNLAKLSTKLMTGFEGNLTSDVSSVSDVYSQIQKIIGDDEATGFDKGLGVPQSFAASGDNSSQSMSSKQIKDLQNSLYDVIFKLTKANGEDGDKNEEKGFDSFDEVKSHNFMINDTSDGQSGNNTNKS